jgi:hypothetical protein
MRVRLVLVAGLITLSACARGRSRSPRSDVPVTSEIGWWAYQDGVQVTDLTVEVIDGRLHLTKSEALVAIRLRGTMAYAKGGWHPFVERVHVSERFAPQSEGRKRVADIQVTPVLGVHEDKAYMGTPEPFDIRVEHHLHTWEWGTNQYIFRAGGIERSLELVQRK